jgi:ribulose-5-phosphate 4-epimerase/fuculose-1-phosphate aldolase
MATKLKDGMSAELETDLDELAAACRILEMEDQGDRVWGHLALRDPDGRGFWMKRAGVALGEIYGARDFVLLDFDGKQIGGEGKSHSEWPIHSEILKKRPDVIATSHTHPFYASVFSASGEQLQTAVARSGIQPHLPPRYEDTSELIRLPEQGRAMTEVLGDGTAVLLRNHGVVTCGRSIPEPVLVAIALDKMCHEMLVINGSGLKWAWPGEEEMAAKRAGGKKIIDRPSVWAYYRRKLARAETQGNPLLATEPVPFAPI